jgi:hypothetical protein
VVLPAASAAAFTAPELFVRMQPWDTHESVSGWIPLASAPTVNYLGGFRSATGSRPRGSRTSSSAWR